MKKSWTCQTQISNIRLFLVPHESPQKVLYYKVNFIHFTTIDKSNYTTLVMLSSVVGTGVRMKGSLMSLMWKEAGVPGENPRVQAGDHRTLSHTTTVEYGDLDRSAVKSESTCVVQCTSWTINLLLFKYYSFKSWFVWQ